MSDISADLIIVGAGVSGLVAAIELDRRGYRTVIVDKNPQVGGRVVSEEADGFIFDRGFQVLLTAYPHANTYLDYEALDLRRFPRGASILTADEVVNLTDPRENMTAALKAMGKVLQARDLPGLWRMSRITDAPADDGGASVAGYLAAAGFSESLQNGFLEPFLRGILLDPELGAPASQASFYMEMFARGYAAVPARGIGQIAAQLAGRVERCEFVMGREVVAVERGAVALDDGRTIRGDALVLALDARQAAKLVGRECPARFHATVCHYFDAPAAAVSHLMPLVLNGRDGGPINHLSLPSLVSADYAPPGRALVGANLIGAAVDAPLTTVRAQLERWFGDSAATWRHLRSDWVPDALPAQQNQADWDQLSKVVSIAAEAAFGGPTTVAGDYTTSASLNGAMASGARAADEIAGSATAAS